jgi:uncharacterized protein (DUF305 family)
VTDGAEPDGSATVTEAADQAAGEAAGDAAGEAAGQTAERPVPVAAPLRPRWLVGMLGAVLAITLVGLGGAVAVVTGIGQPYHPADDSADAGFTRDMIHDQAVQIAQVARDHSTDPAVRLLAFDIETQQLGQIGQMRGWLQTWQLSEQTDRPHMAWMGGQAPHQHDATAADGALMPGMATTTEMTKLRSLSGKALDVFFLQLMIRHHQGGVPMARYAGDHARVDYVQDLAGKVVSAQTSEIVAMEQMLRERGGTPLPAP